MSKKKSGKSNVLLALLSGTLSIGNREDENSDAEKRLDLPLIGFFMEDMKTNNSD